MHSSSRGRDFLCKIGVWGSVLVISGAALWILSDLVLGGLARLSWTFVTTAPENAGRSGGIAPVLVSTGLILAVSMAVALPVGIGVALLLAEFSQAHHWFGRLVRRSLDVLAAVPSIVFGLFGNAFFSITLGLGFSILSGGLTLACMVLPILIRSAEEALRSVPDDYRLAGAALGISRTSTVFHILLPSALPGVMVGVILGLGRAIAETAALLFTSGYVDRFPGSLLDSGRALSVHIYDLAMNVPGGSGAAYSSALVLVISLLIINLGAMALADFWQRQRLVLS